SGTAQIVSGDNNSKLSHGDSAHYRGDLIHSIENTGDCELIAYLVVTSQ
ncbi:MAG: mannose-6-phosphate isomerase-like protein (cupin superfamily), partial [Porticoccaceae bacterium]